MVLVGVVGRSVPQLHSSVVMVGLAILAMVCGQMFSRTATVTSGIKT